MHVIIILFLSVYALLLAGIVGISGTKQRVSGWFCAPGAGVCDLNATGFNIMLSRCRISVYLSRAIG